LTKGQTGRVFVLSIPDWGISPFAASHLPDATGRDHAQISREIDVFNHLAEKIATALGVEFIDITAYSSAPAGPTPPLFVADGLHPSGEQYRVWAERLAEKIKKTFTASPQ
jgi:lysophospholipase L1-like esterase